MMARVRNTKVCSIASQLWVQNDKEMMAEGSEAAADLDGCPGCNTYSISFQFGFEMI